MRSVGRLRLHSVRLSSRSTNLLGMLKSSTGLEHGVLARFALCLSIKQQGIPNPDEYNRAGSVLSTADLFGKREQIYLALMINRLNDDGLDQETYLDEMIRAHLNRGMIGLKQRVGTISDFYDLVMEGKDV